MKERLLKLKAAWIVVFVLIAITMAAVMYYFLIYNSISEIDIKANYAVYHSVDELEKDAELIMIGMPADSFENRIHKADMDPDGTILDCYTLTDVKIKTIMKKPDGLAIDVGQTIQILEPIGLIQHFYGREKWKIDGYDEMEKDNEYILFLKANSDGIYCVINMNSGKYNLVDDHSEQRISRDSVINRYSDQINKE